MYSSLNFHPALVIKHHPEKLSHTSTMPMIKFSYFDIEAKGELIRLLLHAGNFDFEDHRIPIADWPGEHKAATTFGQLPMLQWDGEELAQSMAIARLVESPSVLIVALGLTVDPNSAWS